MAIREERDEDHNLPENAHRVIVLFFSHLFPLIFPAIVIRIILRANSHKRTPIEGLPSVS